MGKIAQGILGGLSGKVGNIITEVKTRTHNELVIDSLQYFKEYLKQGKYHLIDIYKSSPFEVIIDVIDRNKSRAVLNIKHHSHRNSYG